MRWRNALAVAGAGLIILAACGGTGAAEGTVEITAQDYSFAGVPETVAPGTELTLTNASGAEVHEMVVVRIADEEDRPLEEILELPEEDSEQLVEFQGTLVALPNEDGANPEGDGNSITVSDPGRYAIVCFIPQGADPAVVEEAMTSGEAAEGPPDMGDGPPHAFLGMASEFTVEG